APSSDAAGVVKSIRTSASRSASCGDSKVVSPATPRPEPGRTVPATTATPGSAAAAAAISRPMRPAAPATTRRVGTALDRDRLGVRALPQRGGQLLAVRLADRPERQPDLVRAEPE